MPGSHLEQKPAGGMPLGKKEENRGEGSSWGVGPASVRFCFALVFVSPVTCSRTAI